VTHMRNVGSACVDIRQSPKTDVGLLVFTIFYNVVFIFHEMCDFDTEDQRTAVNNAQQY